MRRPIFSFEEKTPQDNEAQPLFIEPDTHSFIVKFWLDEQDPDDNNIVWRGHITHVATGQRKYYNNLREMNGFLIPHLQNMKIRIPIFWRIYQWFLP